MKQWKANLVSISCAVEGTIDEAVLKKLIESSGATVKTIYGKQGKEFLKKNLNAYNNAAQHTPWIVLVDLDAQFKCAPELRKQWLPTPSTFMCFRVAVREIEAWLLADREAFSNFFGVPISKIPTNPDSEADPKHTVIQLAKQSSKKEIQLDLVPRPESGRKIGAAYNSRLIEYVQRKWHPSRAARNSDSLRRALKCLKRLIKSYTSQLKK